MTDVKMLPEKAKSIKQIPELANGLNMPNHMAEHIYMFSGKSIQVKMKTTEDMLTQLTDWFGGDFRVLGKEADEVMVKVTCNEKAIRFWALQYGPYVEIISPVSLREKLKDDILKMAKKYES